VILFDEIEEFCLDRTNPSLTMESRMLTTAMLTKLADLRGSRRCAFFIATNRLTALDAAVMRPGHFERQLLLTRPSYPLIHTSFPTPPFTGHAAGALRPAALCWHAQPARAADAL
jgi:hypothetical protein